jgi:hypothetical protein
MRDSNQRRTPTIGRGSRTVFAPPLYERRARYFAGTIGGHGQSGVDGKLHAQLHAQSVAGVAVPDCALTTDAKASKAMTAAAVGA